MRNKYTQGIVNLFELWGSSCLKAAQKTLMKFTPDLDNIKHLS